METAELDTALEELELRLERLRALYEQYFLGMEKIEPAVARKDVDRRIYVLRREKIRNTAKRFKLQTIIQRYNTFQQYWQRICREIENGTYKRHMLRAQQRGELLTIAARKRLGRGARTSKPPEGASASQAPPSQAPSAPLSQTPGAPPLAAAAAPSAAAAPPAPAPPAAARPPGSPPPPVRRPPPPKPGTPAVVAEQNAAAPTSAPPTPAAPAPAAAKPLAAKAPVKPAPAKFESLDLDMDFMGDWDPSTRRPGAAAKPAAPVVAAPKPAAAAAPAPAAPAKPAAVAPAPPPARPAAVAPPPPAPAVRSASIPPAPVAAPPRPMPSQPPRAPVRPAAAHNIPLSPRIPAGPGPALRPAKPAPAAAPPPKPAPAPAASASHVDDARLRDLHSKLQQAKQQTKEANVSYEGLAKSIRATEAKLREQHKNRKIDFDVVIKDGKAVVKPIVR